MDTSALTTLGHHLQSLRQARGLSLSQLASAAGIAKSNLSRLEQGGGNPTLDTLWRLAVQLHVPFGTLVAPINVPLGEEDGVQVRLIDQGQDTPQVDVYWMHCDAHTTRRAEAHTSGVREALTLISGALEAGPEDETVWLLPGQSLCFAADQPHLYRTHELAATLMLTITYDREKSAP
ncbi:helix-turn-helix domain-containing protein [Halomonas sp. HNIBRBA4712]|uniref:helix-turn-helix domain-containing protein n=1 Tax=Halomonas sp. HNIBRBA4712 TaxID=3373087 RepID=UPI0037455564